MNKKLVMTGVLSAVVIPGCVSYTRTEGEEPTKKKFQSGETARFFYEAIFVQQKDIHADNNQTISLSIGLRSPISWGKRITDQKRVNDAFRSADLDSNGSLTLKEAQRFSESKKAKN